jgi:hypothetical protein
MSTSLAPAVRAVLKREAQAKAKATLADGDIRRAGAVRPDLRNGAAF